MKILKKTVGLLVVLLVIEATARIMTYGYFVYSLNMYPQVKKVYESTSDVFMANSFKRSTGDPAEHTLMVQLYENTSTGKSRKRVELVKTKNIEKNHFIDSSFSREKPEGIYRILCVGGSTTVSGYAEHLETLLDESFGPGRFEVLNFGINAAGSSVTDYLVRNKYQQFSPDMIIVYHGFNDITTIAPLGYKGMRNAYARKNYGIAGLLRRRGKLGFIPPKGYVEEFKKNVGINSKHYENMIRFCRQNDITLVLSTFARPDYEKLSNHERQYFDYHIKFFWPFMVDANTYGELLGIHNDMIRKLAKENGVLLVPARERLLGGYDTFTDNCHFNNEPRIELARIFYDTLRETLEKEHH